MDANKKRSELSKARTIEGMGEFWDSHDFTEFDANLPDANFDVTCAVPVEIDLLSQIEEQAHLRGVSVETLVNLWLQQKVSEAKPAPSSQKYSQSTAQRQVAEKK